jgi:hypothetical protein
MAQEIYEKTKQFLEEEIDKIWLTKPNDVTNLSNVLGAFEQSGSVKIYADAETRGVADILTRLRAVLGSKAVEPASISLVAGSFVAAYAEQWPRYYQFKDISAVMDTIAGALEQPISDAAELDELLKLSLRYVYRVSFWIDTEIPWKAVTDLFRQ